MAATRRTSSRTFTPRFLLGSTLALTVLTGGGCVSYTNVPEPDSAPAFTSANNLQAIKVTRKALEEVIYRYPMRDGQGRYSINLPSGTTLETAGDIANGLPQGIVIPFEGMDTSIPTYHIGRIWIRASDAKVDVLYPARSFDGSSFMGTVTVWMRGGMAWRVTRVQHWAPGTIPTPPIFVPLPKEATVEREMMNDEQDVAAPQPTQPAPSMPEPIEEPTDDIDTESEMVGETPATNEGSGTYRQIPVAD
jgi:hypothetical protein